MTVRDLISFSYMLRDFQIEGGPRWVASARYDIDAKDTSIYDRTRSNSSEEQLVGASDPNRYRLRNLLAERFHLTFHFTKQERPGYLLLISDPTKLHGSACPAWPEYSPNRNHVRGQMRLSALAAEIAVDSHEPVVDGTHSDMCYDLDIAWTDDINGEPSASPGMSSVFTALHDVGLKLVSRKEWVQILVVDHVERPSPN